MPKRKLIFDYEGPDGPLKLIYQAPDNYHAKKLARWKLETAMVTPACALAYYLFGFTYWWAYPMLFLLPVKDLYHASQIRSKLLPFEAKRVWLLQNGD